MDLAFVFVVKQKTAYEMLRRLVGSEMCIRDRSCTVKSSGDSSKEIFVVGGFFDHHRCPLKIAIVNYNIYRVVDEGIFGGNCPDNGCKHLLLTGGFFFPESVEVLNLSLIHI